MIMFKQSMLANKRVRNTKKMEIAIEEPLESHPPILKTERDKVKYIKRIESVIRKSLEYKEFMRFLKQHMDMNKCSVIKHLGRDANRKYSIEIHHEPFTLFDIVDIVLNRRIQEGRSLHELDIADEVMSLHYGTEDADPMVGLIPLSTTMHEACHAGKIFIPLQLVYQRYDLFFRDYEPYIESRLIQKIEAKARLSATHDNIASNSLNVNFVTVDGFTFPEIPEEWAEAMSMKSPE